MKPLSLLPGIGLVVVSMGCEPERRMPQPRAKPRNLGPADTKPAVNITDYSEELRAGLKSGDPQK